VDEGVSEGEEWDEEEKDGVMHYEENFRCL
jgi:hypothetical protein